MHNLRSDFRLVTAYCDRAYICNFNNNIDMYHYLQKDVPLSILQSVNTFIKKDSKSTAQVLFGVPIARNLSVTFPCKENRK